jgi:hypothetical protein
LAAVTISHVRKALRKFTVSLRLPAQHRDRQQRPEAVMDLWFLGLIIVLALLTWGGIVLCERLLVRP